MSLEFKVLLAILTFAFIGRLISCISQIKEWNKGICKECGTPWEFRTYDSQGGRMYCCQCDDFHTMWVDTIFVK